MRPPLRPALALLALLALAALIVAIALGGFDGGSSRPAAPAVSSSSPFDGAELPLAAPLPSFTLVDESGRSVSLRDYRGRVTVISSLYASCGATCVLIAQQIRGALDRLARPPAVLIVSADPSADTAASAHRFLAGVSLAGRAQFLLGPRRRLPSVWRELGVRPVSAGRAAFARAATVLLLDARGRKRVIYGVEQLTPEALAHDIGKLQGG